MARLLALMVFVSCGISALCLSMMAFTLATGELPMHISPILKEQKKVLKKADQKVEEYKNESINRFEEKALLSVYEDLQKERAKLAAERKNLVVEKQIVEEIKTGAVKMQEEIKKSETRLNGILQTVDKTEVDNIRKITMLMSGMEPAEAAKMVMEQDDGKASRILYFMNQKQASKVINHVLQTGSEEQVKRMKRITDKIQLLADGSKNE